MLVCLHWPHHVVATQTNFSSSSKHGVFTTLVTDDFILIIINDYQWFHLDNYHPAERKEEGGGTSKKRYPTTFETTPPSSLRHFLNLEKVALRRKIKDDCKIRRKRLKSNFMASKFTFCHKSSEMRLRAWPSRWWLCWCVDEQASTDIDTTVIVKVRSCYLLLVIPAIVCPGLILWGQPRSWWRQHL